jgi:hypothetical protein
MITAAIRPFLIAFPAVAETYPLTSDQVQRLLDSDAVVVTATRHAVTVRLSSGALAMILPATRGGGDAFALSALPSTR